ncbi:related to ubiquitin conjugating enzyme [Phialocephala subalpina]|uniref:Related to ubiquitin conjugating enzyme n=1 Tax=Phialocephala subalpina TaxID=576137 RepID=A0A1L7WZG0_9HELO|nr:related to ubiquitin conjugating enzyme [Phialocephala subalpina]
MPRKAFLADITVAAAQSIAGITSVTRGSDDNDVLVCFTPATGLPIEITLLCPASSKMPRKAFLADITVAAAQSIAGITSVTRGSDDNDVLVCFTPATGLPIEITLLCPDVSEYPSSSSFMAFTETPGVSQAALEVLQDIADSSTGVYLPELIGTISRKLQRALATGSRNDPLSIDDDVDMPDAQQSDEESDDYGSDYGYESDHFGIDGGHGQGASTSNARISLAPESAAKLNKRIRQDLRAAKFAGFSIGILSGMQAESINSMLSLSIRVAKLGLSEEAIQAWDLEPQQYIVLIIRYMNGYKNFESVILEAAKNLDISFRVGISNQYKPTLVEALAAFTDITKDAGKLASKDAETHESASKTAAGFSNMFISSSLNDFINGQFISLLKIRSSVGLGWDGAKRYFNDKQGRLDEHSEDLPDEYYQETSRKEDTLPDAVTADQLKDRQSLQTEYSVPLLAAQFCMRYLTRCTEFCLVCHDRIEEEFEALKPYVCSKPLCLYQYMSLGFGPSVEHEIATQPYVVDLLVSFAYTSAYNQRLREYPTGMSLMVPPVSARITQAYTTGYGHRSLQPPAVTTVAVPADVASLLHDVQFDINRHEMLFDAGQSCPVRIGEWVVVTVVGRNPEHYRVEDISFFPTVNLSPAVNQGGTLNAPVPPKDSSANLATPATTPPPSTIVPAKMVVYNQNFDDMNDADKSETIVTLLQTLPSVKEMGAYLTQQSRYSEPSLKAWKERVSPAALGILRWIIASNRSCIVQVDKCPGQEDTDAAMAKVRLDQRVSNISTNWVQFRFAQGSPDKEQRFYNALKSQQELNEINSRYPTIWAWHGSPLQNWHSIIRSGLDFKETLHGRAYGHGVYHAMDQNTSTGYAQQSACMWHGSELKISSAMSLNEIVNCPTKFASSSPYLVVQHVDWIQCRYLLVLSQNADNGVYNNIAGNQNPAACAPNPTSDVEQDPSYTAKSTLLKPIGVPKCAATISRAFRHDAKASAPSNKRHKNTSSTTTSAFSEWAVSEEDMDDIQFLMTDEEDTNVKGKGKEKSNTLSVVQPNGKFKWVTNIFTRSSAPKVDAKPLTDFVPGSLDQSTLPMLEPPSYATSSATKSLNRALQEVLAIQKKTPLHELGWFIDQELISNVYQWIVELHSFDAGLPLAKDMKAAGLTSIVLEIRYGKDFPFSPPFVRVIRPRFLPFLSGGGGHVTAGGAMCMELLTNTGWSSVSTIESVLLQVRMAISSLEPKPARLESRGPSTQRDYGTYEAIEAFKRACMAHGWKVPPEFDNFRETAGPSAAYGS